MQEVRMRQGNKKIFHLEAWVVKVMSLYKVRLISICAASARSTQRAFPQHFFYGIDMSAFD